MSRTVLHLASMQGSEPPEQWIPSCSTFESALPLDTALPTGGNPHDPTCPKHSGMYVFCAYTMRAYMREHGCDAFAFLQATLCLWRQFFLRLQT